MRLARNQHEHRVERDARDHLCFSRGQEIEEMTYIRSELEVRNTSLDVLIVGVVEMTVNDLLGESEWSV